MKIIVTNDDGPHSPLLSALTSALREAGHQVVVVVPEKPRSAAGLARTYHKPLRVRRLGDYYLVNGFPADAVFAALRVIAPDADLLISGINIGENLGVEATYGSGTVGAAIQGGILGVRSLAVSMEGNGSVELAMRVAVEAAAVADRLHDDVLAVSINIPSDWKGGLYCVRKLARAVSRERVYEGVDPRGEKFYWRWGPRASAFEPGTDAYYFYVNRGITILGLSGSGIINIAAFATGLGTRLDARHVHC